MNEEVEALHNLERAFKRFFKSQGQREPDVGILVITIHTDGVEMQYLGLQPAEPIAWDRFFADIVEGLRAGKARTLFGTEIWLER